MQLTHVKRVFCRHVLTSLELLSQIIYSKLCISSNPLKVILPQEEEKALKGKYCTNPKAFENASKQRRRKVLVLSEGKKKEIEEKKY